jgi:hypothetical protein
MHPSCSSDLTLEAVVQRLRALHAKASQAGTVPVWTDDVYGTTCTIGPLELCVAPVNGDHPEGFSWTVLGDGETMDKGVCTGWKAQARAKVEAKRAAPGALLLLVAQVLELGDGKASKEGA